MRDMAKAGNPVTGEHKYQQEVTSPEEHEERPGRSLITTDHEVIRQWAEERGAQPSTVPGSEYEGRPGRLLFDFPGGGGERLEHISWDDWFAAFDERRLNFLYQEHRSDGSQSDFFRNAWRAEGSHEHPRSALNLRLVLATFGLVSCSALAVLTVRAGYPVLAVALIVLAAVAAVDLTVVGRRVARRRRRGEHHTLFE